MSVSRFKGGLTNTKKTDDTGNLGVPDPTRWHQYMNDFDEYDLADWVITTTEAGTGSATEAVGSEDGGVLVLTNAADEDDCDFLQFKGGTNAAVRETFKFESGKKLFFKSRFKVNDADQVDIVMGLQITDTTPLAVTDGVYFQSSDEAGTLSLNVTKDSSTSSGTVATLADDTYVQVGFYYNGKDEVQGFLNDAKITTLATTNLPDDEELTISFGVQNGEDVAQSMSIDYIFVAKER
jgi:hypothetical protein